MIAIHDMLETRAVVAHFQPVLSARRKSLVGFEALARGVGEGGALMSPDLLFSLADGAGIAEDVDRVCRQHAVHSFSQGYATRHETVLFLNLRVPGSGSPERLTLELDELVGAVRLPTNRVGFEILESAIDDVDLVQRVVHCLRAAGFLIVLDDVGSGHSNLDRVPLLKPDLLKVDRTLVSHLDSDYHKRSAFKSLVDLGRKIGSLVVAEGIETEDEAMVALELGADLLQGYLVGIPRGGDVAWHDQEAQALDSIELVARRFRDHMVGTINERKLQHRRFAVAMNDILSGLAQARSDQFDGILEATIGAQPDVECAYVLDHAGIQITDTIWNAQIRRRTTGALFHPAPRGADHSLKEYYYILLDVDLHKYTTEPYVSLASGSVCRTISTYFRERDSDRLYILCIDVTCL